LTGDASAVSNAAVRRLPRADSVAAHYSAAVLPHRVDAFLGLTGAGLAVARHWLGQHNEAV
jgi:hypothetical protein